VVRLAGALVAWFLLGVAFSLLFSAAMALMSIGGSCASGGPYVIEVECPSAVALLTPLSIFIGLAAVVVGLAFARGFGTPLLSLAWPILFCGLGSVFLGTFASGDVTGLLIGILFVVMGLVPLVLALRADPREVVIGRVSVDGAPFASPTTARRWLPRSRTRGDPVEPHAADWLLAIGTTLAGGGSGILVGLAWFAAVS
jgi:hypothetical protein